MAKIAIIGAGMAGLGAAYELSKQKHEVTIFERSDFVGGLAGSLTVGGVPIEQYYHHMFPTYDDMLPLAQELGIGESVFFKKASTAYFIDGVFYPFNGALDLLRFYPLPFFDRIRTGLVVLYLRLQKNWKVFENVRAVDWLRNWFGRHAYEVLWDPLLTSKFGAAAQSITMAWFWGRIYERPTSFGYFRGGFALFVHALVTRLASHGVKIITKANVSSIEKEGNMFVLNDGNIHRFDQVLIATPPAPYLKLAGGLIPQERVTAAEKLKYMGTVCAIVVLDRHLTPHYWINNTRKDAPFVVVVEQTRFVPDDTYHGLHPVYLARYIDASSDYFKLADDEIWKAYIEELKRINPQFDELWIKEKYLFRAPFTQPVVPVGYEVPTYESGCEGLWWVSMSHIYPMDRGTDRSLAAGRDVARRIMSRLV